MTETELALYEVPVSRWKYVLELGLHGLLFLFSVLLVLTGLVERDSGILPDTLMTVAGLLFGPMGALGFHNVLRFLRDPRPALRITEEGILNRTYWSSVTFLPWEEVVEIRRSRRSFILEVVLRDWEAFRARQGWTIRALLRLRVLLGGGRTLPLFLPQLDAPVREVVDRVLELEEAREISGIREAKRIGTAVEGESGT